MCKNLSSGETRPLSKPIKLPSCAEAARKRRRWQKEFNNGRHCTVSVEATTGINCGWQMQNTNRLRAVFVFVSCGCRRRRRQVQTLKMKVATSGQDGGRDELRLAVACLIKWSSFARNQRTNKFSFLLFLSFLLPSLSLCIFLCLACGAFWVVCLFGWFPLEIIRHSQPPLLLLLLPLLLLS